MGISKEALARKKPITAEHFVPASDEQAELLALTKQKLALAKFGGEADEIEKAQAEWDAVCQAVRETGLAFTITSVGRLAFEELLRAHPPTDEQREKLEATFNPDTFWPALFAASIESDLSADEWRELVLDSPEWGMAEISLLRETVMQVNTATRVVELGN